MEVRTVQQASGMAPKYDGHCRRLTPVEVQAKLEEMEERWLYLSEFEV